MVARMYGVLRDKKGQVREIVGHSGKAGLQRVREYRIPPAWKDVTVNPDDDAKVIAQGYDEKGRLQRIYSKHHTVCAKDEKFERVRKVIAMHEVILGEIMDDIHNPLLQRQGWREEAIVALLIYHTGIRPGSNANTGADLKAYGATTLKMKHVKVMGSGKVWLKFTGKKGVQLKIPVKDKWLAEELRRRKQGAGTCYNLRLFKTSASSLNQYFHQLDGGELSAKDLRTMRGTMLADSYLANRRVPAQITKRKKIVREAIRLVAAALGNTLAVAKASYVDPKVLERWEPL